LLLRSGLKVYAGVRAELPRDFQDQIELRKIGDFSSTREFEAALRGVDALVHLAARVHVMRDLAGDPLAEYRRVNTDGTLLLAKAAVGCGVRRFVFMSTVKVNGERTTGRPFSERDVPAPADSYAVSKWEAEKGLAEIAGLTGLQVISLRPPLVYGPGVKGNFLRLLKLIRSRLPLPLASVANSRSMIYVGNLASAIERALRVEPAVQGSFLVSDDADLSTPQLVRMLGAAMGRPARLVAFPPAMLMTLGRVLGKGDEVMRMIESLRVDCSGIKQQLQWMVPFTVEQGLKETADWFARTRSAA
jgi:nucleoside-diphosphate-sugar epimerase